MRTTQASQAPVFGRICPRIGLEAQIHTEDFGRGWVDGDSLGPLPNPFGSGIEPRENRGRRVVPAIEYPTQALFGG